jgi:hypothetical protein
MTATFTTFRLALGIEVVDALRGDPADVEIAWENVPLPVLPDAGADGFAPAYDVGAGLPRLSRGSRPGLFHVLFDTTRTPVRPMPPARVRVIDGRRHYVPRRLEIPFIDLADVIAEERSGTAPAARGRVLGVFPGAAYPMEGGSTGIRGRAVDADGAPVRWCRAEARHDVRGSRLGYAHGDDRGEFLLLLGTPATALDQPGAVSFNVRVVVSARPVGAPPPPPLTADPTTDPLGDLLPEVLPSPGAPDNVAPGSNTPPSYTRTASALVPCELGRVVSPAEPFVLP